MSEGDAGRAISPYALTSHRPDDAGTRALVWPGFLRRAFARREILKQNLMVSADCEPTLALRASQNRISGTVGGCIMREEFASNSFLAVTVASLVVLCSGLLAIAFS